MAKGTEDFSIQVDGVAGVCPAGERYAEQHIAEQRVPVLSCEGPCVRGDIARLGLWQYVIAKHVIRVMKGVYDG